MLVKYHLIILFQESIQESFQQHSLYENLNVYRFEVHRVSKDLIEIV